MKKQLFQSARDLVPIAGFLLLVGTASAQTVERDTVKAPQSLDEVIISAVRATGKTPVTFTNVSKEEIAPRNLGQDIPILLNYLPSVVTTSDAGAGIGYTGIRVRGSDATRVNITINGVPFNDSESHGTFWVNLPDFASSVESLQLQRGVGTSTNGSGAFGASLNLLTDAFSREASAEIANSFGSFNSRKHTAKFSTGLMNGNFEFAGRLSVIKSDGYIDRASSDLKGYFLQGTYNEGNTLIKGLVFGGREITYQAWNGIDPETMNGNRTFNSAGLYTDEAGNVRFYDNEVDNYQQDHYQLHWNQKYGENWSTNVALHYTRGIGFFENFREDADFAEYGLAPVAGQETTDLVRRKWLDNDFYGFTFSANYRDNRFDVVLGGGWNKYHGAHFGTVEWARFASQSDPGQQYYFDTGHKTDGNIFGKVTYELTSKLSLFGDLQYRRVSYRADGVQPEPVADIFHFFNPKGGLTYSFARGNQLYASYAVANREPNRVDYESGTTRPERLHDVELGWRYQKAKISWNANLYYMAYQDQLILTGALNDVGNPIRSNSERSYRLGFEFDATVQVTPKVEWRPNFTVSANKNIDLNFNGQNFGTTDIAYSPNFIAGNLLSYAPLANLKLVVLSKYVGRQFMNNIESPTAELPDYLVNDFNVVYVIKSKKIFDEIILSGLVNNFLDREYVSNGYMWDVFPYYYPQAGINFLAGATVKF